jgi:hypothetical protein
VVVVVVVVVYASDIWHTCSPVFEKSSSKFELWCSSHQDVLSGYNQKSPTVLENLNSAARAVIQGRLKEVVHLEKCTDASQSLSFKLHSFIHAIKIKENKVIFLEH